MSKRCEYQPKKRKCGESARPAMQQTMANHTTHTNTYNAMQRNLKCVDGNTLHKPRTRHTLASFLYARDVQRVPRALT
jgi:hypothetical protein